MNLKTNKGTLEFIRLIALQIAKDSGQPPAAKTRALVLSDEITAMLENGLEYATLGNEGPDLEPVNAAAMEPAQFAFLKTRWTLSVREAYTASVPFKVVKAFSLWELYRMTVTDKRMILPNGFLEWAGYAMPGERLFAEGLKYYHELVVESEVIE